MPEKFPLGKGGVEKESLGPEAVNVDRGLMWQGHKEPLVPTECSQQLYVRLTLSITL